MTIDRYRRGVAAAAFLASGVLLHGTAAQAQAVGKVGAVNPASVSTPPGASERVMELGNPVIYRERVVTSDSGSLQLAFLDKSTISVGPNSDLVIDEYVYDPNAGQGRMALTLTRGALRFVGGKISHGDGAQFRTPVATIGIRGGAGTITHGDAGTQVVSNFGRFVVETPQGITEIRRPGFSVTVRDATSAPSAPGRALPAQIEATTRQLSSAPSQNGSAPSVPTDTVAGAIIGAVTARTEPFAVVPLAGNATDSAGPSRPGVGAVVAATSIANVIQNATTDNAAQDAGGNQTPGQPLEAGVFALSMSNGAGGRMPYVTAAVGASGQVVVSPVLGYRPGSTGTDAAGVRAMQVGFNLNGQGSDQSSALVVAIGDFHRRGTTYEGTGGFNASGRTSAGASEFFATGNLATVPGTVRLGTTANPVGFSLTQDRIDPATGAIVETPASQFGGGVPNIRYEFSQTATGTTAPAGLGQDRPALRLEGYAAGIMRTNTYTSNALGQPSVASVVYPVISIPNWANDEGIDGGLRITLDPVTSRASADMTVVSLAEDTDSGFLGANYQLGGADTKDRPSSAYIDKTSFALRERVKEGAGGAVVQTSSAYVATDTSYTSVAYENAATRLTMVPWDAIARTDPTAAAGFFPDVNICACAHLQWGFWSVNGYRNIGAGPAHEEDRGNLMLWVAGQTATASAIPTTGTATYSGMAIANISTVTDGGRSSYVAGGNFSKTVDFGARTGTVAITNLDGRNYTGSTALVTSTPNFYGSLSQTTADSARAPAVNGVLMGSFYGPASGGVGPAEVGGQFALSGTNYMGAGIFAAKR